MRTRPGRSVTKRRPSGANAIDHGNFEVRDYRLDNEPDAIGRREHVAGRGVRRGVAAPGTWRRIGRAAARLGDLDRESEREAREETEGMSAF